MLATITIMYAAIGFGLAAALLQMAARDNTVSVAQFLWLLVWVPVIVIFWPAVLRLLVPVRR